MSNFRRTENSYRGRDIRRKVLGEGGAGGGGEGGLEDGVGGVHKVEC